MLCQVFGKVPGTKQPSGEYTNRFHGNSYVPNTRQGEERLPWDHTHQKVVFPVYELRMYAENHAHEGHCRCEEYCMRIAARENYHRYDDILTARIIEKVIVHSRQEIEIYFIGGYTQKIDLI